MNSLEQWTKNVSPEYLAAVRAHDEAQAVYRTAVAAYRAGDLSHAQFGVAAKEMKAATAAFDAAFTKEQGR